jgi:hypothetical protein
MAVGRVADGAAPARRRIVAGAFRAPQRLCTESSVRGHAALPMMRRPRSGRGTPLKRTVIAKGAAVYRKILLTLDGSDVACEAVPHARELARALHSEITLLQVVDSVAHLLTQTEIIEPIAAGGVTADVAEQSVAAQPPRRRSTSLRCSRSCATWASSPWRR